MMSVIRISRHLSGFAQQDRVPLGAATRQCGLWLRGILRCSTHFAERGPPSQSYHSSIKLTKAAERQTVTIPPTSLLCCNCANGKELKSHSHCISFPKLHFITNGVRSRSSLRYAHIVDICSLPKISL